MLTLNSFFFIYHNKTEFLVMGENPVAGNEAFLHELSMKIKHRHQVSYIVNITDKRSS